VRDLRPHIVGRTIASLRLGKQRLRQPWQAEWSRPLKSRSIQSLRRRGKWILADLDRGALLLHLGMTGQLTVHATPEPLADHVHLVFRFDDGRELRFRDVRRFGSAVFFAEAGALEQFLNARLGPEPFGLDAAYFRAKMQSANRSLKAVLLDQAVLAGVGNIYADESCHRAGLHPGRRASTLSVVEIDRLQIAIEEVLTLAIEGRGSTIRDYIGGSGLKGNYQKEFGVYGRTGKECATCGSVIVRERHAGRSSHFCPRCQKPPS